MRKTRRMCAFGGPIFSSSRGTHMAGPHRVKWQPNFSNIHLLGKFGCHFTLCGPAMWVPRELEKIGPPKAHMRRVFRIEEALEGADVVLVLRVQTERLHEPALSANDYILLYQLNAERLRGAKADAIVLHPGPMNRGIEISPEVADGPQSCVLE